MPTLVSFPLLLLRSPYQSQICTSRESMRQTNRLSVSFQSPLVLLNSPPIRSPLNARKVKSIDLILSKQSDNTLRTILHAWKKANRTSQTSRRKSVQTREAETRFVRRCCYCLYSHHPAFVLVITATATRGCSAIASSFFFLNIASVPGFKIFCKRRYVRQSHHPGVVAAIHNVPIVRPRQSCYNLTRVRFSQ